MINSGIKILFIKLGALGDVINTLPLAVALKKEMNASIHWLVAPLSYPVVNKHTAVDKVILFDKNNLQPSFKSVMKNFRECRYDLVLDLQRTLKSGVFTSLAKGERKLGFDKARCKEMTWLFPFDRIRPNPELTHMLDQYLEFAGSLGIKNISPEWNIPKLAEKPQGLPESYIVLNTGATKAANKWQPEKFARLSDLVQSELKIKTILTGGPEDIDFASQIILNAEIPVINYTGKTSIGELSEIIQNSLVTITCDTGPMHLAVALGKKVIALFGPSNPIRTGPYKGIVIKKNLKCSPCNKKSCKDNECMKLISPSDVFEKIPQILKVQNEI